MPVSGLPGAVEVTLTALLQDNSVTSWKVAGEGDSTVVVLRLKPANSTTTTMADPVLNRGSQVQYFRKKPPCQVRRDQERARKGRQQAKQQNSESNVCHTLFDSPGDQSRPTVEDRKLPTTVTHQEHSDNVDVCHVPTSGDQMRSADSNVSLESLTDELAGLTIDNNVAGFTTGIVRDYVATLAEKAVQRRLRDKCRNIGLRKVVSCNSDRGPVVLCESDDIVVEYSDNLNAPLDCLFWFVKQDDRNQLPEERARLSDLRRGERVSSTQRMRDTGTCRA